MKRSTQSCGERHPSNPTFVPCMRRAGHPGDYHWSTSGCAGGSFAWHGNDTMFMAADKVTELPDPLGASFDVIREWTLGVPTDGPDLLVALRAWVAALGGQWRADEFAALKFQAMKASVVKCCEAGRMAYPDPCPWRAREAS